MVIDHADHSSSDSLDPCDSSLRSETKEHPPIMMTGVSPGIRGEHDPAIIPVDAVTYFVRAGLAAQQKGAELNFVLLDERCSLDADPQDEADREALTLRNRRIQGLLQWTLPEARLLAHSQWDSQELGDRIRAAHPSTEDITSSESISSQFKGDEARARLYRQYTNLQTAVVLGSLDTNRQGQPIHRRDRLKLGWVSHFDAAGQPVGGEVSFDRYLPQGLVTPVYVHSAHRLFDPSHGSSNQSCAPYLVQNTERHQRIFIPIRKSGVGAEVAKLHPGISLWNYREMEAMADVVNGDAPLESLWDGDCGLGAKAKRKKLDQLDPSRVPEHRAYLGSAQCPGEALALLQRKMEAALTKLSDLVGS